jgi:hypothetical protein
LVKVSDGVWRMGQQRGVPDVTGARALAIAQAMASAPMKYWSEVVVIPPGLAE